MKVQPQLQGPGVLRRHYTRGSPRAVPMGDSAASAPTPWRFWASPRLVAVVICIQFACQLALLVDAVAPLRVIIRVLSFSLSLGLLVLVPGKSLSHPAKGLLFAAMAITSLNIFNPHTSNFMAGMAQLGIQFSILAPLLWVTRLRIDGAAFRRTLALLFLFNAASAAVGVLQVYFPGRFQPALSTAIESMGEVYTGGLQFETAAGQRVFRPFGLTDVPGGAATGAFYAVLLGAGFLISARKGLVRVLSVGGIFLGIVALYLCQVRAMALMLGVCLVAVVGVLALSGRVLRLAKLLAVVGGLAVAGVGWAVAMGGQGAMTRWSSLFEQDVGDVYYSNRGHFLEGTLSYFIPEFPVGAGLGRYGMANAYFGGNNGPLRSSLWAEIQWTAWVFDGGLPVMVLYPLALLVTAFWALRLALRRQERDEFWLWGTLIFAYDLGAIALTFSYPFFMSQAGMEFWLLNAALFAAFFHASNETLHPHRR